MAFRRATAAKWALTDTANVCAQPKTALSVQIGSRLWPAASKTVDLEIPTTAIETCCRTLLDGSFALLSWPWTRLGWSFCAAHSMAGWIGGVIC